jgi:hypothetical protein
MGIVQACMGQQPGPRRGWGGIYEGTLRILLLVKSTHILNNSLSLCPISCAPGRIENVYLSLK